MTRLMGRRSSGARLLGMVRSIYGAHESRMASAHFFRSTDFSFSLAASAWHWRPRAVPNSRNASRYRMLRSR